MQTKKMMLVVASALLAVATAPLLAQNYPAKPVRVLIPWPPGGSNDVIGRIVMQKLSETLGQQFVVENRGGASGAIGADLVAKAPADGYTIMVHSTSHVGNASMYKKLPYDTLKDFVGISLLANQPGLLTVHPALPVKSVREFIALARAHPGQINFSSSGNGSTPHLSMALFAAMAGLKMVHVPYKGGAPQVTALMSGETQSSLATISTVLSHVQSGRLRGLGVASLKRSTALPDMPPIATVGLPGYEMDPWVGVFAPAGTPRAIVEKLNTEINRAMKQPDVLKNFASQASDPWYSTVDEFDARLKADYEKYAKLIKLTGASID
ncbi:MAG: tripartite tricarboxylate transporter substrate binding protein [Betaproteobacteria bacterium]|nr:tripartite tricarboxylate transporter substrate binding protein [Betaproteobacteria bacterium]